jgi:hypothetical protein
METTVWDAFVFTQRLWKHPRPNQEALLTRLALNLVDKKRSRMAGGESSKAKTDSGERKEIAVTKVFCYVLCNQIDHNLHNLWGEGAVKHRTYRKECE